MEGTRIEILKNGSWLTLILREQQAIRYNVVINKIGSMSNREISHSNTFELPYVYQNIQALGINVFNKTELAKAFNSRYVARYYVKDKLTQKGYLIINNTDNGTINVNFIDEALEIIDSWGSMTYYQLLNSETINIPADYKAGIKIMQNYAMDQTKILPSLNKIPSRGNYLAKFPNNLNAIGEKFQLNKEGVRVIDCFNPYQSRPIFNVKALFDIAIESFGYTPVYDNSVDWKRLAETYMIDKDLAQSQEGANSTVTKPFPSVDGQTTALYLYESFLGLYIIRTLFVYPPEVNAMYPNDMTVPFVIPDQFNSDLLDYYRVSKDYQRLDRCILIPDISVSYSGFMEWRWNTFSTNPETSQGTRIYAIWQLNGANVGYTITQLTVDEWSYDEVTALTTVRVNKQQLAILPPNTTHLIGVVYDNQSYGADPRSPRNGLIYTESFLPPSTISYDQYNQYEAFNVNLTHAAPRETVKDLLSAVMQKEGILMSFDNTNKKVKLFTYGSYITRKIENNFKDWSLYFRKEMIPSFNTDYGNEYAKINEVGLMNPFNGNTFFVNLTNQGTESKYKDFIQNLSKKFNDVESVLFVQNNTTPYFEYINKGLGLVESPDIKLGQLRQVRADNTTQGVFSGLDAVYNVNGLNLPNGLIEWYDLIDNSVRVEASFLIPVDVVKSFDMSEPIYVEGLGGFYIIEEISEYIDAQTPVSLKLIKMIIPEIKVYPDIDDRFYDELAYDENFYE